ncbi:MAG: hypothetical protein ACLQVN_16420 [Bryobacteraceae bacterium]
MPVSPQETIAITEQTTLDYRRDFDRLNADDQARVLLALRRSYELLRARPRSFFSRAQRPLRVHLKGGLSPSLCSLRVGRDIRLIVAVDDDPVFGRTLVTLFRVVRQDEVERSYRSIAHLLYRDRMARNNGVR